MIMLAPRKLRTRKKFWYKTRINAVPNEVLMVGFHPRPHIEEIFALWLIINFATRAFLEKHCWRWQGKWWIKLGIDIGKFDEHPGWRIIRGELVHVPRKGNHCCATLVADALETGEFRISDYQSIQAMLRYVHRNDAGEEFEGDSEKLMEGFYGNLGHALKYAFDEPIRLSRDRIIPTDTREHYSHVTRWALQGLDARYNNLGWEPDNFKTYHLAAMMHWKLTAPEQRRKWPMPWEAWLIYGQNALASAQAQFQHAYQTFHRDAEPFITTAYDGKELRIARWVTANHHAGAASRAHGFHVLMQIQPEGTPMAGGMMVATDYNRGFDLRPFVYELNDAEQRLDGGTPQVTDPFVLTQDGEGYPDTPWYFFHGREREGKPPGIIVGDKYLSAYDKPLGRTKVAWRWQLLTWLAEHPNHWKQITGVEDETLATV